MPDTGFFSLPAGKLHKKKSKKIFLLATLVIFIGI